MEKIEGRNSVAPGEIAGLGAGNPGGNDGSEREAGRNRWGKRCYLQQLLPAGQVFGGPFVGGFQLFRQHTLTIAVKLRAGAVFAERPGNVRLIEGEPGQNNPLPAVLHQQQTKQKIYDDLFQFSD